MCFTMGPKLFSVRCLVSAIYLQLPIFFVLKNDLVSLKAVNIDQKLVLLEVAHLSETLSTYVLFDRAVEVRFSVPGYGQMRKSHAAVFFSFQIQQAATVFASKCFFSEWK